MNAPSLNGKPLSSEWGGLSKHLIATFYEVERGGPEKQQWVPVAGGKVIKAPLTEASMEVVLSWQSPFEGAGADKSAPALSAMMQSGALQPFVSDGGGASKVLGKFEGRTGITKLNSMQVFSGMPPIKLQVSAMFRAWSDPQSEVEAPFDQLMAWALPKALADDGAVMSVLDGLKQAAAGGPLDDAAAMALLPSLAPVKIAMRYKGRLYSPLVIESIGKPLSSPIDGNGRYVELLIPMTLCTLTALDRKDWSDSKRSL
jgi:hypothetical protein